MLREIIKVGKKNRLKATALVLLVAFILYVLHATAPLIIILPVILTVQMRFPAIIKSWLASFLFAIFILFSLIQIGATIQFLLLPTSTFTSLAGIVAIITFLAVALFPKQEKERLSFFTKSDLYAFLLTIPFLIPMLGMIIFTNGHFLAEFGGIQGIDGVNHFGMISELTRSEHYMYKPGFYYPNGFHISVAFIQSGLGIIQTNLNWLVTAKLYVMQYVFFGSLMLYTLYYFTASLKVTLLNKVKKNTWIEVATALTMGSIVTLLYFTTFMYHGFLSYFYICGAILAGALYLFDTKVYKSIFSKHIEKKRYTLAALFLLVSLGASMNWPLWTPALLLIAFLFLINDVFFIKKLISWPALIFIICVLLHLIPIYFQLKYSGADSSQGINLLGGLRTFHGFVLLGGVIVLGVILIHRSIEEHGRMLLQQLFLPLLVLLFLIVAMQYFGFGEVRYYAIKTSLLVEIMLIALAVTFIGTQYKLSKQNKWYVIVTLPVLVFISVSLLMTINGGTPFQDGRQLFRLASNEPEPPFYESDTMKLSGLGEAGKIEGGNVINLHKNDAGKLYGHMQLFYFANMMSYKGSQDDRKVLSECSGQIYGNLFRQDFSDSAQNELIMVIKKCVDKFNAKGISYYIVTDNASMQSLEALFGKRVKVI